jgi:hypothetical protein
VHDHLVPVEVLPALVDGLVDHGEELQRLHQEEHAHRRVDLLDHRIRRALADLGLAVEHGLGRDVFRLELDDLDVDAALLGAVERDHEVEAFDRRDVAERQLEFLRRLRRRRVDPREGGDEQGDGDQQA